MKILREGKTPPPKEPSFWWVGKKVTCPNCFAWVELEKDDGKPVGYDLVLPTVTRMPGGDGETEVFVSCPTPGCDRRIHVTRGLVVEADLASVEKEMSERLMDKAALKTLDQ